MLGEALITDCRETSAKPSLNKYRQQYHAWGVAILLHLFTGILFYKIESSLASQTSAAETIRPVRKIIQVQLVSMAQVVAKKSLTTKTPEPQESKANPVMKSVPADNAMTLPVKTDTNDPLAKLHTTSEKSKNKLRNKKENRAILKKTDVALNKLPEQIKQENTAKKQPRIIEQTTPQNDKPNIPARLDAHYLSNPPPEYPEIARELGQEGTVLLKVKVSTSGLVLQVSIHRSSGHNALDTAAINAVRHWKFVPANIGNVTQEDDVIIPVSFSLEDA
nr:energy transducer TonB [uncultured Tolumonas sp.]